MAEDQKNTPKKPEGCCEGTCFADMMHKMAEAKDSGAPPACAEMLSRMMQMFCGGKKKEGSPQKAKENPVSDS
jgi:hypothetical protein